MATDAVMSQDELLASFQSITMNENIDQSREILERYNWNLEQAVQQHFNASSPPRRPVQTPPANPPRIVRPRQSSFAWFSSFITRAFDILLRVLQWLPIARNLPRLLTTTTTQSFHQMFERAYQASHPTFFQGSFNGSANQAKRSHQFLLAYFHSPQHYNTQRFCTQVLADQDLINFINENFVFWGGDITDVNAFQLAEDFSVCDFPCLLILKGGSQPTVMSRMEGDAIASPRLIQDGLAAILDAHGAQLVAARLEEEERQHARLLREEQEAAFRQAEEEDRLRQELEEARQRAIEEQEAEERRKQQEESEAIERALQAEQREKERKLHLREEKRRGLPEEPAAGTAGVTTIRVITPTGPVARRFLSSNTVQQLKDFAEVSMEADFEDFLLVTVRPRKVFTDLTQTLDEAALCPNAVVHVESVCDD
eukprot:c813_g1_i1.p1 GENE.c813_g1_i1~~c813_g1_i1.p1  ORF type:complete len:433 (-),score=119.31 c813_g1_i1:40-1317(-)